jgi:hypothetical protein
MRKRELEARLLVAEAGYQHNSSAHRRWKNIARKHLDRVHSLLKENRSLRADLERITKELAVTDCIMTDYKRVLDAVPECPVHGECVPHAVEWIEKAKELINNKGEDE